MFKKKQPIDLVAEQHALDAWQAIDALSLCHEASIKQNMQAIVEMREKLSLMIVNANLQEANARLLRIVGEE